MNPTLNILGISGSLRAQSRNTGLLRFAKQCLPPTVNFQIADLSDVPFYNADHCDSKPEPVQTLIRQVTEADALVLACPGIRQTLKSITSLKICRPSLSSCVRFLPLGQ